jgi:hypothetical protein
MNNATTTYANKYYEITSATTTKYIFAGDDLVATLTTAGATTTKEYIHADHLGSTNVVTDNDGEVVQTLDYYPYGEKRIESGEDASQRQFIGQFHDEDSDLSYLNARYYSGGRGHPLQILGDLG